MMMRKKGEKDLADLFDRAAESAAPVPPAPEHELQANLAEMIRRGIEPRIRRELKEKEKK